jgi:Flagellar basal body-associated protein
MAETDSTGAPTKKGRKLIRLVLILLIVGGAGTGAALYARSIGLIHFGSAERVDPKRPRLVPREGLTQVDYATRGETPLHPEQFKPTYYPLKDNFTSNLRDTETFIQIGLGVSTYYDERVLKNLETHEMAMRSAVLMTLADQDGLLLMTPKGKEELKGRLKAAINDVLKAKEGFGGIDDVYFTSFVMQ